MNHTFLTIRQRYLQSRWRFDSTAFPRRTQLLTLLLLGVLAEGCSTVGYLVGNADPVSHKAQQYTVRPMTDFGSQWKKVEPVEVSTRKAEDIPENEISDWVFQSQKTASIVSLNSSCRGGGHWEGKSLQDLTNLLLIGIDSASGRQEETVQVNKEPALKTTLTGMVDGRKRKIQTVVFRQERCVYDLMYFSSEKHFAGDLKDFEQFVASFATAR